MPRSAPEYRLSPKAEDDLKGIWLHSFENWGLDQANRYLDELTAAFAALAESPKRAMACDQIRAGYRFFHSGRHVIYFRETHYGIAVTRVLHDRMLPSRHL